MYKSEQIFYRIIYIWYGINKTILSDFMCDLKVIFEIVQTKLRSHAHNEHNINIIIMTKLFGEYQQQ